MKSHHFLTMPEGYEAVNGYLMLDVTAKSPKNAAKTTATLQNQVGKVLLTLASI